jgi:Caspase domain
MNIGRDPPACAVASASVPALDRLALLIVVALLVLLVLLAVLPGASHAAAKSPPAERRIALVIGNARYVAAPLDNPNNDARLIAGNLARLGFEVAEHHDLGARDFRRVVRDFARRVQDAPGASVFYYAGHGVQIEGRNYLLPVDANPRAEEEVKDESIDLDDLFVSRVDRTRGSATIVILDACRDNPFADKSAGRSGGRTRSLKTAGGLAEMSSRGTLVAFASAPGAVAEDGPAGNHSVYTKHLAAEMMREGVEVEQMFKNVRVNVLRDTKERQVPWVNTSLTVNFAFNPGNVGDANDVAQDKMDRLEAEIAALKRQLSDARNIGSGSDATSAPSSTASSASSTTSSSGTTTGIAALPAATGTGTFIPLRPPARLQAIVKRVPRCARPRVRATGVRAHARVRAAAARAVARG